MSKVDLSKVPVRQGSRYPKQFQHANGDTTLRESQAVAPGLTVFGANRVLLPPGAASSLRHYHTEVDELVIVVSGELVMLTNAGETPMRAGDVASFPKGVADAHCFVNRSAVPAVLIAIGDNSDEDNWFYPESACAAARALATSRAKPACPFPTQRKLSVLRRALRSVA